MYVYSVGVVYASAVSRYDDIVTRYTHDSTGREKNDRENDLTATKPPKYPVFGFLNVR